MNHAPLTGIEHRPTPDLLREICETTDPSSAKGWVLLCYERGIVSYGAAEALIREFQLEAA